MKSIEINKTNKQEFECFIPTLCLIVNVKKLSETENYYYYYMFIKFDYLLKYLSYDDLWWTAWCCISAAVYLNDKISWNVFDFFYFVLLVIGFLLLGQKMTNCCCCKKKYTEKKAVTEQYQGKH